MSTAMFEIPVPLLTSWVLCSWLTNLSFALKDVILWLKIPHVKHTYNMHPVNIQYLGYLMNFSLLKLDSNLYMLRKRSTTALAWMAHSFLSSPLPNLFLQHFFSDRILLICQNWPWIHFQVHRPGLPFYLFIFMHLLSVSFCIPHSCTLNFCCVTMNISQPCPAWLWDPPTPASARRAPHETHPQTMTTGLRDSGQAPLSSLTHTHWSSFPAFLWVSVCQSITAFINVLPATCNHTRSHTAWSRNYAIHVWVSTPTPVPRMTNFHTWTLNDDTTDPESTDDSMRPG